jgi:Zn-dependent M28 family amino/carboxypeptidase
MAFRMLLAALFVAAIPTFASAQGDAITPDQLRRHIEVLASDAYEGRKPGTEGEIKTVHYIAGELQRMGFEPAAGAGWFQPVGLVERRPVRQQASWSTGRGRIDIPREDLILVGREPAAALRDRPVVFAGHGGRPAQFAPAQHRGAVVLMLQDAPKGYPDLADRTRQLVAAGTGAVILIGSDDTPWRAVEAAYANSRPRLQIHQVADVQGTIRPAAADRLIADSGHSMHDLVQAAAEPGFRPVTLNARVSLAVTSEVRSYVTNNVVGRLRGSGRTGESVLFLGHWDHLGICRPASAPDRICNGAVDNASGIAVLLEAAGRLARGRRPERDILVMATTAEEMGLLGAHYFAERPTVPLRSIVAALNVDTVAIHRAGEPVAVIGRGVAPLDRAISETAAELGRHVDGDKEADAFVTRQDGWALARVGVPAVMVGGSFSNMAPLSAFLEGPYHKPEDDLGRPLILDGAAEDANFLVALGRRLADPRLYQPPRR